MVNLKNSIQKLCSFYVSNMHLVTMLIPYLSKKLNIGDKFIVLTQSNLEEEIEVLLSKLNIKEEEKEKIMDINWEGNLNKVDEIIEEKIIENMENTQNIHIIINGENSYINEMNKKIQEIITNKMKQKNITIINCYEVMNFNQDMKQILDTHDKILNTSGEREIEDVFNGYERRMA